MKKLILVAISSLLLLSGCGGVEIEKSVDNSNVNYLTVEFMDSRIINGNYENAYLETLETFAGEIPLSYLPNAASFDELSKVTDTRHSWKQIEGVDEVLTFIQLYKKVQNYKKSYYSKIKPELGPIESDSYNVALIAENERRLAILAIIAHNKGIDLTEGKRDFFNVGGKLSLSENNVLKVIAILNSYVLTMEDLNKIGHKYIYKIAESIYIGVNYLDANDPKIYLNKIYGEGKFKFVSAYIIYDLSIILSNNKKGSKNQRIGDKYFKEYSSAVKELASFDSIYTN